jgi:hypothetical protein
MQNLTQSVSNPLQFLGKSFGIYEVRGVYIEPTYWMAIVIFLLLFLLVFTLARMRYLYVHWSMGKSAVAFTAWGFLLAIIIEGFLIIGGRTLFTEIVGWDKAPKPVSTALDSGREKLIDVLGVTEPIPESIASEKPKASTVLRDYESLTSSDAAQVRKFICEP